MIVKYLTAKVMELTEALNARGPAEELTIADYALELLAECGEFGDAIKKWRRMSMGFRRLRNPLSEADARQKMKDEAGDLFMCFLRVCKKLDIDPVECLAGKYNRLVEEEGESTPITLDDIKRWQKDKLLGELDELERKFGQNKRPTVWIG